jgi:hypothetical protein
MKNLLIIGDSFAQRRCNLSWISLLGNRLDAKVYGIGLPGQSWWKQWEWYQSNSKNLPDASETTIIWVHTSAHRLPCETDARINPWVLFIDDHNDPSNDILPQSDPDGKLFKIAKDFYSSPLYVEKFYAWAMIAWWKELNLELSKFHKVIHLFGFYDLGVNDTDRLLLRSTNSIVVDGPSLGALSKADKPSFEGGATDNRINHFNEHNNEQLSKFLAVVVNNTQPNLIIQIDNLDDWQFEDKLFNVKNKFFRYGTFFKDFKK